MHSHSFDPADIHFMLIVMFDCVVICACLLSLALCARSVCAGIFLQFVSILCILQLM